MITVRSCAVLDVETAKVTEELLKKIKATPTEMKLLEDVLVYENSQPISSNKHGLISKIEPEHHFRAIRELKETPDDIEEFVIRTLANAESIQNLKNWIFHEKQKVNNRIKFEWSTSEPSTFGSWGYLEKAQAGWERKMLRSLNSMCQELGIRLAGTRDAKQSEAILVNWTELSLVFNKPSAIKPVFGPKDLLEVLISIKHPNIRNHPRTTVDESTGRLLPYWGLFNLPMRVKNMSELCAFYAPLGLDRQQCGVDELFSASFETKRVQEAESILHGHSSAAAQTYLQRGCPLGYRAQIWSLYLNAQKNDEDVQYYSQLKLRVAEDECMTDLLVCKEVQLTASNDDMHFVFCDYTYQVLLPFTRDSTVLEHFQSSLASPPRAIGKKINDSQVFPPSGVIPFHGFSMYVLPLCYLYDDPVTLYVIFRQLYIRYFYKLHTISNDPSSILGLCLLFERLLQWREPEIFFHLRSSGIQPIRFVFKWIMRAFSGFLAPDQVLLLWDRILGFDSLEILAVLAVAIFSYRKENLLLVNTTAGVEAILADLTPLRIVSLLQLVLFTRS